MSKIAEKQPKSALLKFSKFPIGKMYFLSLSKALLPATCPQQVTDQHHYYTPVSVTLHLCECMPQFLFCLHILWLLGASSLLLLLPMPFNK